LSPAGSTISECPAFRFQGGGGNPDFNPGYNFEGDNPTADQPAADNWDGPGPGGGGGDF
jgi:hypothetical protein